jgi:chorismate dehydratase
LDRSTHRIGCVRYLNAKPLIFGHAREVSFHQPAALANQLAAGRLDAGLCPIFEWMRNPHYALVDGAAIASDGPVHSVFLAHRGALKSLRRVRLDPSSRSSTHLVQVLLAEFHATRPKYEEFAASALATPPQPARNEGLLLIGDQANHFRKVHGNRFEILDLGAEWKRATGLPFVFAAWLVRDGVRGTARLAGVLRKWKRENARRMEMVVRRHGGGDPDFARFYLTQCIRYDLGDAEKRAIAAFGKLLHKYELIPKAPPKPRWI